MDFGTSLRATSKQIAAIASASGEDMTAFCNEYGVFEKGNRWIEFWVEEGSLRYHLSGEISTPPMQIAQSRPSFHGIWDETGSLADLDQASQVLRAWLVECKEVDELPHRSIRRWSV